MLLFVRFTNIIFIIAKAICGVNIGFFDVMMSYISYTYKCKNTYAGYKYYICKILSLYLLRL